MRSKCVVKDIATSSLELAGGPPGLLSRAERSHAIPWHCLVAVFGATCIPLGVLWDISWHESIGRDTFWTPAHMVIYLGGVVPGLTCGWLALRTTFFGTAEERAAAVSLWGVRAPLGAWISIWGCFAMLTSAPFDDWWHNAYGLDVQILSPPHSLLAIGMFGVALGVLLLVLSWQNRAAEPQRTAVARLFVFMVGIMTAMNSVFVMEYSFPNEQHALRFYLITCWHYPALLVMASRASAIRWGATLAATVYMGVYLLLIWVLPRFAAQPMLAPIYNPVTVMVPPPFPLLLVLPALALDWLVAREKRGRAGNGDAVAVGEIPWWRDWVLALALALAFLALIVAAQWTFSAFMLSPAANNWFFAGHRHWPYTSQPGTWMDTFWRVDSDPVTARGLVYAFALAFATCRGGLWFGNWMLKVRR